MKLEQYRKGLDQYPFHDAEEELMSLGEANDILNAVVLSLDDRAGFSAEEINSVQGAVRAAVRLLNEARASLRESQDGFEAFCIRQESRRAFDPPNETHARRSLKVRGTKKGCASALETGAAPFNAKP